MISYYYHHSKYPITSETSASYNNSVTTSGGVATPHVSISKIRSFSSNLAINSNSSNSNSETDSLNETEFIISSTNLASSNSIRTQNDTSNTVNSKTNTSNDSNDKSITHNSNKSSSFSTPKSNLSTISVKLSNSNLSESKTNAPIKLKRSKRDLSKINKDALNLSINHENNNSNQESCQLYINNTNNETHHIKIKKKSSNKPIIKQQLDESIEPATSIHNEELTDFDRRLYSRRSKRYVRQFNDSNFILTNKQTNSFRTLTASPLNRLLSTSNNSNLNKLNLVQMNSTKQDSTNKYDNDLCSESSSLNIWNENFYLFNPSHRVSMLNNKDKTVLLTSKDTTTRLANNTTTTTTQEQDTATSTTNDLSYSSFPIKHQTELDEQEVKAKSKNRNSNTNKNFKRSSQQDQTTPILEQQEQIIQTIQTNETTKDLMTLNEFLKEFQIKNNTTSTNNPNEDLMEHSFYSNTTELIIQNHDLKSTTSTTKTNLQDKQLETSLNSSKTTTQKMNNSNATSTLSLLSSQMMSSSSSLLDTDSKKIVMSKSKKLGQILKLASVRGVKSKSLKHKFTSQLQQVQNQQSPQQKHSFINFESDSDCHVCQKSLHEKKALHCKNCLITVHDAPFMCKNELNLCVNYKLPRQNLTLSISNNCSNSQTLKATPNYDLEGKIEQSVLSNNKYNTTKSEFITTTNTNTNNSSQIFKQNLFARERPKSMDITKYFQAHLSKSTSNMYSKSTNNDDNQDSEIVKSTLRESIDCLHFKFDENSIQASNSSLGAFFRSTLTELNKEFFKYDSDFSATNWADLQTNEFLNTLNKQMRNRQENIFEFVKTEVNYLKILNITQTIYMNAMQDECKIEQKLLQQMFPDLTKLINLHKTFLDQLVNKYLKSSNKFIESIGDVLLETFSSKHDLLIELYGKVCCSHLSAKTMYKQLSINNKQFINFLQECRKYPMLRRYQIPDCLLIITQRPTKYLTLIESMISNSKEEKKETDLLVLVLERLKLVLRKVNDTVAFYQNSSEFKKIFDLIDPKSFTFAYYHSISNNNSNASFKSYKDNTLSKNSLDLQKRFTKADLIIPNLCTTPSFNGSSNSSSSGTSSNASNNVNGVSNSPSIKSSSSSSSLSSLSSTSSASAHASEHRKIISINQVYVKYMSNNSKIYKDVTCLTMNDMIVFLQVNDKGKLIFMNENSVIPCTTGILVRPKLDEILSNRTNNNTNSPTSSTTPNISLSNTTTTNNSNTNGNNTNTNSQNNTTGVSNNNNNSNNINSNGVTFLNSSSSNNFSYIVNTITNEIVELKFPDETSRNQWATLVHTHITPNIGGDNNSSTNTVTKEETQNTPSLSSSSSSTSHSVKQQAPTQPNSNPITATSIPTKDLPITKPSQTNAFRCNSNVSTNSSINSSGHGSLTQESILSNESSSSSTSSSKKSTHGSNKTAIRESNELNLSSDLASLLYSFNGILEQSSMYISNHNGNLIMRSASSAGETVTKYNTDINAHLSIPKRAETFNGISKDNQIDSVNLNSDLISKSRTYKNSIDLSDVKPYIVNENNNNTNSKQSNGINSSSFSADSGLCADLNHDIIDIGSNCSSLSLERLNECNKLSNSTRISRTNLENILKFILSDYLRLKNENESLHKELELKNKSIDMLKSTMDECKDQLDFEKINLQKRFNELDLKKEAKK